MPSPEDVQKALNDAARLEKQARRDGDHELERTAGDLKRRLAAEHIRITRASGDNRKRTWPW